MPNDGALLAGRLARVVMVLLTCYGSYFFEKKAPHDMRRASYLAEVAFAQSMFKKISLSRIASSFYLFELKLGF